jgi:rhodanese-related sulfurtransferase
VIERVDALEARDLLDEGVRVLDVLPEAVFTQEHLPGARSLPLETFRPEQVEADDRGEALLVYCFDQHCDLSARAARRLAELGFTHVYDLIGGRAAWTALGFPTDGQIGDQRRISHHVQVVPTVPIDGTIADLVAVEDSPFPTPVTTADGILLGALHPEARALPSTTAVADCMVPAPGTIRPELRVDEVAEQLERDGLDHVFVTAVNGELVGLVKAAELHV